MALRLVNRQEELIYRKDGAVLTYRRLPSRERSRIANENTKQGVTNWNNATLDMMKYIVLGWKGVEDLDPATREWREVPYDPESISRIPDDIQIELLNLAGANISVDDQGNRTAGPMAAEEEAKN